MDSLISYFSVITGILLTVSETLPYVKKVKSNGILQLVQEYVVDKFNSKGITIKNERNETNPLLADAQVQQETKLQEQINALQEQINTLRKQKLIINEFDNNNKITIVIESVGAALT